MLALKRWPGILTGTFSLALNFEYPQINSTAHKDFYTSLASDIRRLVKTLGLPDDPVQIGSQFQFVRTLDQTFEGTTKIPDGLGWLLRAESTRPLIGENLALLIARSLENPKDPGD